MCFTSMFLLFFYQLIYFLAPFLFINTLKGVLWGEGTEHRPGQSLVLCCSLSAAAPDECQNYKILDGADRAQEYRRRDNYNLECDKSDFRVGWYRFSGKAGNQMPDKCVPRNRCGTRAPGWLNGTHPSQTEGTVSRTVCYHWFNGCCEWSNDINVRNCGGFFVYELQKTPECYLRYCGNGLRYVWRRRIKTEARK